MTPSTSLIQTIAGTGRAGYDGDGGQAAEAALDQPFHCDLDGRGSLYLAEAGNHCVRKLDLATGVITTVAGCGAAGYSGDGGPATQAAMNEPYAVQVDANGDLYIVDRLNAAVRRVDAATGVISTVAGTGEKGYGGDGGPGAAAKMREPNDCWSGRLGRPADRGHPGPAGAPPGPSVGRNRHLRGNGRQGAHR